jgi:hypothetical protein
MSIYDEAVLIQKPSGYKAEKLYNVKPSPEVTEQSSVEFDGVDDELITDGDSVAQPTTYSFWAKASETGNNLGLFGHGGDDKGAFHFNFYSNKPLLYLGSSYYRYWVDNSEQDDGEWHHWVVYSDTNDITNSKLYVDGVLQSVDSTVSTGSLNAYTEGLTIGSDRQSGGGYFEGSISDFAVFSRELSAADVKEIYNYGSPNDLLLPASYGTDISQSSTKSVEFDGVDDYLNAGGDVNIGTNDFSISAWVKTTANGIVVAKRDGGVGFECGISNGNISYYFKDASSNAAYDTEDTVLVNDGNWHHIVWSFNRNGNGYRYIDGVNSGTNDSLTAATDSLSNPSVDLGIGARVRTSPDNHLEGSIDNVGIYDKALTQAEVTRQYNGGQPIDLSTDATSDSLVAYYKMGDGTLDSYPLIADQTDATLGSDLLSGWDFTSGWTTSAYATIDDSDSFTTTNAAYIYKTYLTVGTYYQIRIAGTTSNILRLTNSVASVVYGSDLSGTFDETIYFQAETDGALGLYHAGAGTTDITTLEVKQVNGNPATMTNMSSSDITTDVALSVVNDLDLYYQMGDGILDSYPLIADQTNATLGSELVTNGGFSGVANGTDVTTLPAWVAYGTVISRDIEDEKLKLVTASANTGASLSVPTTVGKLYKLQCSATGDTGTGGIHIESIGNVDTFEETSYTFKAIASSTMIYFRAGANSAGTTYYDNISVKQVQGNPAMMTNMSSDDIVAWTPNIETDFDVARSSTTTRINASGYIEQVAPNVPRLNYDSGDSCPYLLTQDASTNLITYPISFGNSYWTKSGASVEGDESSISETFYTSDFSSDTDGFTSVRITGTGNNDNISDGSTSKDNVYKQIAIGGNGTHYGAKTSFLTDGKYYRVKFDYYIPTSNTIVTELSVSIRIGTTVQLGKATVTGAWATFDKYIMGSGTDLWIAQSGAAVSTTFDSDGDITYITNVIIDEYSGYQAPKEIPVANSEELVTNGDFATDSDWTKGSGWTIGSGVASASASTGSLSQSGILVSGKIYRVNFEVTTYTSGDVRPTCGTSHGTKVDAIGSYTQYITSNGTQFYFSAHLTAFTGTIDNVSVKEVTSYSGGGFEREAYKLVEDTSNGTHKLETRISGLAIGNTYAVSLYAKACERNWIALRLQGFEGGSYYDLTNGVVGSDEGSTPLTSDITELANGWYRIDFTCDLAVVNDPLIYIYTADSDGGKSYQGDGTSGVYIAYSQLEQSDYASSLMLPVTEGSTTSRVGDVVNNAGNQSLFSGVNSSGVLYAEIAALADDGTSRKISLYDGTNQNRIFIVLYGSSKIRGYITVSGVNTFYEWQGTVDITNTNKIAIRWAVDDFSLWINGTTEVIIDTIGNTFAADTLSRLNLAKFDSSAEVFYGKTKAVAVFDYLSDDQMVKLTEEGYNTFNALATANNFIIR